LESVFEEFKEEYLPDLMHTYCEHLADQISRVLPKQGKVLFSGGGTHNTFLIELIDEKSSAEIVIPSNDLIDFKEALIFGFLGLLKYLNQDNCFASVTGSKHNHSTGVILKK
jgi:anhydro-N-acetylmuramic acid kinase